MCVCVSSGPVVAGAVAALLMFAVGVLMSSMFCLYYTGFICKLKDTLPRVLIVRNIYLSIYDVYFVSVQI